MQDVRNQFRRSRLGIGWLIINLSLVTVSIGYVYGHLFHVDLRTFFPILVLGLALWAFISTIITQGCQTFAASEGYIKQFAFAKQVYIFRFMTSALINLCVGLGIFCIVAIYTQIPVQLGSLWFIPGMLALIIICFGHLIIFSYLGARFRDLPHALSGFLQVLFYVTPIIFTADMLKARGLDFVYQYNPFYYLVEIARYPLIHGQPAPAGVYYFAVCYGVLVWLLAIGTLFKCDSRVAYWL
jgi:ABC-type polysaccharide/polyol phosphate export permease